VTGYALGVPGPGPESGSGPADVVGGKYADRALMPMLYVSLGALAVVLALFTLTAHNKLLAAVTIALIGALGFATVPPLQKRVLDQAHGAPTLASAVNIGAFNLGNALSAWLGGLVIAAGFATRPRLGRRGPRRGRPAPRLPLRRTRASGRSHIQHRRGGHPARSGADHRPLSRPLLMSASARRHRQRSEPSGPVPG
jgi:MFS family permease